MNEYQIAKRIASQRIARLRSNASARLGEVTKLLPQAHARCDKDEVDVLECAIRRWLRECGRWSNESKRFEARHGA